MRPLEFILLSLLFLFIIWPVVTAQRPRYYFGVPLVALGIMVIHLLWEGFRWQMWPAYLLTGLAAAIGVRPLVNRPAGAPAVKRWPGIFSGIVGLLLWLPAALLPWALPVPMLPTPTGPFAVGTVSYHLIDENRPESYSDDPNDVRQFMVQIWYPTDDSGAVSRAPYIEQTRIGAPILAASFGFPDFLFNHLNLAENHAYLEAEPSAAGPFPVLIFAHGLTGIRSQNSYQVEELVSHGYVVAAIDHTYGSRFAIFPDGRVVEYDPDKAFPPGTSNGGNTLVRTWAEDISFLLDEMATWAAGSSSDTRVAWTDRLDLDNIGVFGHSTGGGAAVELCARDKRCDAALGLDAWLEPVSADVRATGLDQPLMFISAPDWLNENNIRTAAVLYENSQGPRYQLFVAGTDHFDFTDFPGFSPITPNLGVGVTENGELAQAAAQAYTLAFFNRYLRGMDELLLAGPSPDFPSVSFASETSR